MIFCDFFDGSRISDRRHCKHYRKCDVAFRYLHIKLIWSLIRVQYLPNNVIMKWTTRFISFNGWIPLKYGSTTTPPIIAHCQKLWCQTLYFTLRFPQKNNISRTPSFDLLDGFSKQVYYKTSLVLVNWRYSLLWKRQESRVPDTRKFPLNACISMCTYLSICPHLASNVGMCKHMYAFASNAHICMHLHLFHNIVSAHAFSKDLIWNWAWFFYIYPFKSNFDGMK